MKKTFEFDTKGVLQAYLEESREENVFASDQTSEKANTKVHFLHLDLNLSELYLFKVVQDGKLVEEVDEKSNPILDKDVVLFQIKRLRLFKRWGPPRVRENPLLRQNNWVLFYVIIFLGIICFCNQPIIRGFKCLVEYYFLLWLMLKVYILIHL